MPESVDDIEQLRHQNQNCTNRYGTDQNRHCTGAVHDFKQFFMHTKQLLMYRIQQCLITESGTEQEAEDHGCDADSADDTKQLSLLFQCQSQDGQYKSLTKITEHDTE